MTPKSPQGGGWANRNDWVANLPPEVRHGGLGHSSEKSGVTLCARA